MGKLRLYLSVWLEKTTFNGGFAMLANWFVECERNFVETGTFNRKGKPHKMPVLVSRMHLSGDFIFTDYYSVVLVKRKTGNFYSVKLRKKPDRHWWDKTPIKEKEYKWLKEGSYSREAFIKWLATFVANPELACIELDTCPPEKKEAA